jgi:transcriptional regulator with XRE-family HTH domain
VAQVVLTKCDLAQAGVDRRVMAKKMGLTYSTLSNKLNGFQGWVPGELEKAAKILKQEYRYKIPAREAVEC